jgi:hypothetical protein
MYENLVILSEAKNLSFETLRFAQGDKLSIRSALIQHMGFLKRMFSLRPK